MPLIALSISLLLYKILKLTKDVSRTCAHAALQDHLLDGPQGLIWARKPKPNTSFSLVPLVVATPFQLWLKARMKYTAVGAFISVRQGEMASALSAANDLTLAWQHDPSISQFPKRQAGRNKSPLASWHRHDTDDAATPMQLH